MSNFFEHIEEYSLSASAKTTHSVTDQEIQETDYVIKSTAVMYRGQEIQPLQGVTQTIEASDLACTLQCDVTMWLDGVFFLLVFFLLIASIFFAA